MIIDLNSETCEDDESQDEDYYYQNEDPNNLIKFTLDANENLIGEQIMNDFCQSVQIITVIIIMIMTVNQNKIVKRILKIIMGC